VPRRGLCRDQPAGFHLPDAVRREVDPSCPLRAGTNEAPCLRHTIRQLPEPRSEDLLLLDEDCKDHACAEASAINKADGGYSAPDGAQLRSDPLADLVDTFEDVRPEPLVSDPHDAIRPVPKGCTFYWATLLDVAAGAAAVAGFFFFRELGKGRK